MWACLLQTARLVTDCCRPLLLQGGAAVARRRQRRQQGRSQSLASCLRGPAGAVGVERAAVQAEGANEAQATHSQPAHGDR